MDYRIEVAQVIRTMIQQSRRATVLADSSKLGRAALVTVCDLASVDRLVTENLPPDDLAQALDRTETRVYVAGQVG
jgi:DeoR family glycerol-3-phosphate regulon repressor